MQVRMPGSLASGYTSLAQRARVVSEAWGEENLFCPNCSSSRLARSPAGTKAIDYTCPDCDSPFQLKSASRPFASRIVDAAYDAMHAAILAGKTPNLLALHYESANWTVRSLVLIPQFAFSLSCLERRRPLGPTARRAGWVGCNILLTNVPPDARIRVIYDGVLMSPRTVRKEYARLRPLTKARHDARGWTLDVLNIVRRLQASRRGAQLCAPTAPTEFTLADVYEFADELARLHPDNKHIEPKIRQQLQILRDMGLVEFLGRGRYRL